MAIAVDVACVWLACAIAHALLLGRSIRVAEVHRDDEDGWRALQTSSQAPWLTEVRARWRTR